MEILADVHRVRVTGSSVFLLDGERLALIDAGPRGSARRILRYLRVLGRSPGELDLVILTHYHPDHAGGASELARLTGARVAAHVAEVPYLRGDVSMPNPIRHQALAAGRRWSLTGDAGGSTEVDSTWIHLDSESRPARIGEGFDAYAEAAQGRVASTRLTLAPPAQDVTRTPWPLRATDVDRMGHVNNAAYWAAVEHRLVERGPDLRRPLRARLDYRHAIDLGEDVALHESANDGRYEVAFVAEGVVKAVEKAINAAGLGVNAIADGQLVRVPIPELSQERRQELSKVAGKYAENTRVAIRNVRRDGMDSLKKMEKDGEISKDEHKKREGDIQKLTDEFIKKVDEALAAKEKDILGN